MENKEIKITVPEGYEIDRGNSTFECIKFKKKPLTYSDIEDRISRQRGRGRITAGWFEGGETSCTVIGSHLVCSEPKLERLFALNKLMNVAEYLNKKTLDWNDDNKNKWYIYYDHKYRKFEISRNNVHQSSYTYFDSPVHAYQAIEILGEDTVKKALGVFK